jgi:hypothetical protein
MKNLVLAGGDEVVFLSGTVDRPARAASGRTGTPAAKKVFNFKLQKTP